MSHRELTWLAQQASRAKTIIEIGSFQGRSTRALADHCRGVVYAVDPWVDYRGPDGSIAKWQAKWLKKHGGANWPNIHAAFCEQLADHLASGRVVAIQATSADAVSQIRERVGPRGADLVFIDGDHEYPSVRQDITLYRGFVRRGGILAGHDYSNKSWPGVVRAVTEAFGRPAIRCDSIWGVTL